MTRFGYDAVTPQNMPTDGVIYGGYVDGHWPNLAEVKSRFPHKLYLPITVNGTNDALCADVETGDFSPAGGARWAQDKIRRAGLAWLYCNASTWPAVQTEVHRLGLVGRVYYWIAQYDSHPVIPAGALGKQFLGDYHGYDKSIFADHLPGIDPTPVHPKLAVPSWWVRELSFPIPATHAGVLRRVNMRGRIVPMQFGRDVLRVQAKVGAVRDGLYGPGTVAKVEAYEQAHHMGVDGKVGTTLATHLGP